MAREDDFNQLIDALLLPVIMHDKCKIVHANPAFLNLFKKNEAVTQNDFSLWMTSIIKNKETSDAILKAVNELQSYHASIEVNINGKNRFYTLYTFAQRDDMTRQLTYLLDASAAHYEKSYWDLHLRVSKATMKLIKEIDEREKAQQKAKELHEQLLSTARKAGMADIATSTLHNIGNVLNSTTVSLSLITNTINNSKSSNLLKTIKVIQDNLPKAAQTGEGEEDKISMAIKYLILLSEGLESEKSTLTTEINSINNNIDHIVKIITTQQTLSGSVSLVEEVLIDDVINEALKFNKSFCESAHITVLCHNELKTKVALDRTKLLQIITNLIKNSIDSLKESSQADKKISITAKQDKDNIIISVQDNGLGILKENLTKIFSYGFTTKKDGHGYGLHASALSAIEMGGNLQAESDGDLCGATFNITLPLEPPTRSTKDNAAATTTE